jgi:hypothetical protein
VANQVTVLKDGFLKGEGLRLSFVHSGSICWRLLALIVVGPLFGQGQSPATLGWFAEWQVSGDDASKAAVL